MATKCGRKVHDSLQMMIIELVFYSNHKARIFKTWLLYRVQAGDRCKIKNSNEKKTSENKYVPLKGKQATSVINSPCLNKRIGENNFANKTKENSCFSRLLTDTANCDWSVIRMRHSAPFKIA